MAKQTRADLWKLLDEPGDVEGEGPYLLVEVTPYLGVKLLRFATHEKASVRPMNYCGPGRAWIFKDGVDVGVLPFPEWGEYIEGMVGQIADNLGVERPA